MRQQTVKDKNISAIIYALAAAVFYAVNVPCSKLLLGHIPPTFMAGLLYLGAGLGVGVMYMFRRKKGKAGGAAEQEGSSIYRRNGPA